MSNLKYTIGTVMSSNKYGDFEIISHNARRTRFHIRFIETGYETDISYGCMIHGEVRDPYYPIYFNVASLGMFSINDHLRELYLWRGMISRCYNPDDANYIYYGQKGVTVCNRWLCCENFVDDIRLVKGYDEGLFRQGLLELDKDICDTMGEKQYNLINCQFVTRQTNHNEMMRRRKPHTSSKYTGVSKLKDGKWQSSISYRSKNIYIGRYDSDEDAHKAYLAKKKELGIDRLDYMEG